MHNISMGGAEPKRLTRASIRVTTLVGFCLALGFLLALPVILDIGLWVLAGLLALAVLLAWPLAWWWCRRSQRSWVAPWLKLSGVIAAVLAVVLATPIYGLAVLTALRPTAEPQVVLSNGSRTVTFQGMIHVGSDSFYRAVIYDLDKALFEGAAIFYEGVVPDKEGDAWLRRYVTGGQDLGTMYKSFASACGLVFQSDYFMSLVPDMKAHPERHVNADVSSLEMKREFERLMANDPAFAARIKARHLPSDATENATDGLAAFVAWQKSGSDGQKALAGTVCRGVMTWAQRPQRTQRAAAAEPDPLNAVLLDFRNRKLVDRILADTREKIFLTYGAAHLPGVYALLKQSDPRWRVVSQKWLRSIEPPDHVQGVLELTP